MQLSRDDARILLAHARSLREMAENTDKTKTLCAALAHFELLCGYFHLRAVMSSTPTGSFRVHVTTPDGREFNADDWSLINAISTIATKHLAHEWANERNRLEIIDPPSHPDYDEGNHHGSP